MAGLDGQRIALLTAAGVGVGLPAQARDVMYWGTVYATLAVVLGLLAQIASRLHGLFPGLSDNLLGLTARFLPEPPTDDPLQKQNVPGLAIARELDSPAFNALTGLGRSVADRLTARRRRPSGARRARTAKDGLPATGTRHSSFRVRTNCHCGHVSSVLPRATEGSPERGHGPAVGRPARRRLLAALGRTGRWPAMAGERPLMVGWMV